MQSCSTASLDLPTECDETEKSQADPKLSQDPTEFFLKPASPTSFETSKKEGKRVRFKIFNPVSGTKIFGPGDQPPMTYELGTAPSKWTQNQLNYLNVRYDYRHEYSFGPLQRLQVPEALTQVIAEECDNILTLPLAGIQNRSVRVNKMGHPWGSLYVELLKILAKKPKAKPTRPVQNPILGATPPDRPTVPPDPSYSGSSVGSADSKAEDYPRSYSFQFFAAIWADARLCFPDWGPLNQRNLEVRYLLWISSVANYCPEAHVMKYLLGVELIECKDDGGFALSPQAGFQLPSGRNVPPLISIEAKRKKHALRNSEATYVSHAAQIYGEMLGQVCHKQLYDNPNTLYQEAFIIHCRHATCRLFYAKFPNRYLQNIVRHGASYRRKTPGTRQDVITLHQSKGYKMKKLDQQAEFYHLIAKLLYYVLSGSSHVGFWRNCQGNPFFCIPPFAQVNFDNLMGSLSAAGYDSDGELDGEMTTDTEH